LGGAGGREGRAGGEARGREHFEAGRGRWAGCGLGGREERAGGEVFGADDAEGGAGGRKGRTGGETVWANDKGRGPPRIISAASAPGGPSKSRDG
jgi:hypothetical protein